MRSDRQEHRHVRVAANSGGSVKVWAGEVLQVEARSIVDLVAFRLDDLAERFDQARTKTNQGKIFLSVGDVLISKFNTDLMRITEDTFAPWTHDLQHGMCSRARWEWAVEQGIAGDQYLRGRPVTIDDFPDHGCFENLIAATEPYGILPEDIPAPFNIFQHVEIDGGTGEMRKTTTRPDPLGRVALEALVDVLVAVSACPDTATTGGGPVDLRVVV